MTDSNLQLAFDTLSTEHYAIYHKEPKDPTTDNSLPSSRANTWSQPPTPASTIPDDSSMEVEPLGHTDDLG